MRILILAHFYPPEMGGAAARLSGLARWLSKFGHDVSVIAGNPNYPHGKLYPGYNNKLQSIDKIGGVSVIRTWVYFSRKKSGLLRIINYLSYMFSSVITAVFSRRRYDVIIVSSPPLFIGLSGRFLSKLWRIPWIFDVRDIWPDVAVEAGEFSDSDLVVRIGKLVTRHIYRTASHLTPVTMSKMDKIISQGVDQSKISVVSNGIDMEYLTIDDGRDWRKEMGLTDKFIYVYAGLLGIAQGLNVIIDAAESVRNETNIHFLIIGEGVERKKLQSRVAELGLNNITFLKSQPRENIASLLKTADAAIIPLANSAIADAVPSKLLEAWGCRKPVMLIAGGEAKKLVAEVGGGVTVDPGDLKGLNEKILSFYKDTFDLVKFGENGYNFVTGSFTREKLAGTMNQVIEKVSNR